MLLMLSLVFATQLEGGALSSFKDLEGQPQRVENYRGRVVVLNFWATWCAPCLQEMPELVKLQRSYGAREVQVIGISADGPETVEQVPAFARRLEINFPVWTGGTTADMQAFGLGNALPATAILNRDGQVVGRIVGMARTEDLEAQVGFLLGDRKEAPPAVINNFESREGEHEHGHEGEDDHQHGAVSVEGASLVPS
jgi:thiol-disulfide isomerase/thioredoxin